jgi:hypothetical protein
VAPVAAPAAVAVAAVAAATRRAARAARDRIPRRPALCLRAAEPGEFMTVDRPISHAEVGFRASPLGRALGLSLIRRYAFEREQCALALKATGISSQ